MKFISNIEFTHSQADKIGVLITNLGTPTAPTKQALKPYLKEFLSDPRVVEVPRVLWWLILNGVILNIRPKRSAHAYSTVWSEQGSPLLVHTKNQAMALDKRCKEAWGDDVIVEFAMRYGQPSVASTIERMQQRGVRKLLVLPLYPQYCASTTGSTFDAVSQYFQTARWLPDFRFISHYHDHAPFIVAVASKIKRHWDTHGRADKLIFSYHGIPKRYLLKGDPYHCECHKTSRLLAEELGLEKDQYLTTFQSRFGREEWLKPYTDHTLKALPEKGVKSVQIVCPGFSADCLETIEEIGIENRDYFLQAGGERYEYIEAMNSDDEHIDMLFGLVKQNLAHWHVASGTDNMQYTQRQALAKSLGAEN
ncbi:ferrochelatase [Alteromonas oceanisediminis]|uniref:ferrochelatase n=1 Tax=Alteromonas oceanisediminis TaxID=2836180 RepID=UPI001BDB3697|nr:ferrochelatase [Alteromonas oceanisediminis]MBT0586943.1 ferrochelatase [Alteromonas oceanisediminis]